MTPIGWFGMSNWLTFRFPGDSASLEAINLEFIQSWHIDPEFEDTEQEEPTGYYVLCACQVDGIIRYISRHEDIADAEGYMLQIIGKLGGSHGN